MAEQGIGLGQELLWLVRGRVGCVALAADGEQQRMNPGGIHGMHGVDTRQERGDEGSGQLVHELTEDRVLLRRTSDHRERPHGVVAVIYAVHAEKGEVVGEAVVAQVIAERSFALALAGLHFPEQAEIRIGVDRQGPIRLARQAHAPAAQHAGKGQLGHALGKRHHGSQGHGG